MEKLPKELWIVAFFLSKYGNNGKPPVELNTTVWEKTYQLFHNKLGEGKTLKTFQNSLKNCRDTYDGHIATSGRKGWRNINGQPVFLQSLSKSVYNQYNTKSRKEIWDEIYQFISDTVMNKKQNKKNSKPLRNPDFIREELILCLDMYFKLDYGQMHGRNPYVIQLSKDLKNLNILQNIPDKESFRSVNSIALKLANFKRLDGNFEGKGMKMGGKMDREIWNEFHGHRNKLEKEASLIRHLYLEAEKVFVASDHKAGYYSDFLYKFHKNRETDPLIMKVKKEMILLEANELKCEVCGFNFTEYYGEIGNDLMEIHYCKEINNLPELAASDMNDFIMVCGNCHKVLDKNYGILDANDIRNIIKK